MQIPGRPNQTPIYKPSFPDALSPQAMWKEPEKEKPKKKEISPEKEQIFKESYQEAYKALSDDEKNLMCAGLVFSPVWYKFLKPYLEQFKNPPRRRIQSDADYYQLLNDNSTAAFASELIAMLEGRTRNSPSYEHQNLEEEPNA